MRNFRILFFIISVLYLNVSSCFAQATVDTALSKFVSAGMAYKDGRYDEAIGKYNEILQAGRESGAVYYNLGNSYFRNGDVGRAVLSYERAKRLIPRDSDLNFNYRYVRSQIDQYNNGEKSGLLRRVLEAHTQFYTMDEMVLIIVGVIFVLGCVFLFSLYMDWFRSLSRWILVLLALILMIYGVGLIAKVQYDKNLAVIVVGAESYFEPRVDSTVHFKLPAGTKIKILKSEGRWTKVQRLDKKVGWVSRDELEEI